MGSATARKGSHQTTDQEEDWSSTLYHLTLAHAKAQLPAGHETHLTISGISHQAET